MRLISSKATTLYKLGSSIFMVGGVVAVLLSTFWMFGSAQFNIADVLFPLGFAILCYFAYRMTCSVDEVWDDGQSLVVKNGSEEARIDLKDIESVSYSTAHSSPWVTLSFRTPTAFGNRVDFWGHYGSINSLAKRVEASRAH